MSRNKNVTVKINTTTKPESNEEEVKDQETAASQDEQQPESEKEQETKKVTRKRLIFQSPICVKTIEVTREKSEDADDEEKKPTFKEKFHKFMNGLGTVALVGGIGLAAYGDYQMKKARELEEEDDDDYPCEDEDCEEEQYDPDSEDDEDEDD